MPQEKKPQNINLNISSDIAVGVYSNLAVITHSPTEVIIDFAQTMPGVEGAIVRQRAIMSPFHAKRLLMALNDNIHKYEENFGTIEEPHGTRDAIPYDMLPTAKA